MTLRFLGTPEGLPQTGLDKQVNLSQGHSYPVS